MHFKIVKALRGSAGLISVVKLDHRLDRLIKRLLSEKVFGLTDSLFSYFAACPKNQFHL